MQAMEVIKEILGVGDSLAGRLLMYDALSARFYETRLRWNPDNPLNGRQSDDQRPSIAGNYASTARPPFFKSSGRGIEMML